MNESKKNDPRFWKKWRIAGAIGRASCRNAAGELFELGETVIHGTRAWRLDAIGDEIATLYAPSRENEFETFPGDSDNDRAAFAQKVDGVVWSSPMPDGLRRLKYVIRLNERRIRISLSDLRKLSMCYT